MWNPFKRKKKKELNPGSLGYYSNGYLNSNLDTNSPSSYITDTIWNSETDSHSSHSLPDNFHFGGGSFGGGGASDSWDSSSSDSSSYDSGSSDCGSSSSD